MQKLKSQEKDSMSTPGEQGKYLWDEKESKVAQLEMLPEAKKIK